jgi:hypothetical protein
MPGVPSILDGALADPGFPLERALGAGRLARLRADVAGAMLVETASGRVVIAGTRPLGRVQPFGSLVVYDPVAPALHRRILSIDRRGRVTEALRREPGGEVREVWLRAKDGMAVGVLRGGATHPLWGESDRVVATAGLAEPALLTVSATLDWDRIPAIPALADPTRLPPGAGTAVLNLLAGLAADQRRAPLRYRGPFPTEELFWALAGSFRFDGAVPDPLETFTGAAEAAFAAGTLREAPLDWTPAPHERLFLDGGIWLQLREGVESVVWEGRRYHRDTAQGRPRPGHRVVRAVTGPGGALRYVASLVALGHPLEDHLIFDAAGEPIERRAPAADAEPGRGDTALPEAWLEALGALLPLDATHLLGTAIPSVWPDLRLTWGDVSHDLVEARGSSIRLSRRLPELYRNELARLPPVGRRALARALVREVLGLVGPPVRRTAATWLEAQSPDRQETLLAAAAAGDRVGGAARAATLLRPLLDALEAGAALPA